MHSPNIPFESRSDKDSDGMPEAEDEGTLESCISTTERGDAEAPTKLGHIHEVGRCVEHPLRWL